MNRYFGTNSHKRSKSEHSKNMTLAAVRSSIIRGNAMKLGTSEPEKWHTILRKEFPDVSLKLVEDGVVINERNE